MINEDKRQAIHTLYNEGVSKSEIARMIKVSPKTVRKILSGDVRPLPKTRCDKKELDEDIVRELYKKCTGHIQRVHEILTEEHNINIGYSTLTQFIRGKSISKPPHSTKRHHRVEDIPGEEMQHDTSPYRLKIGKNTVKLVCSALYFRYSKMRYVRFYLNFNRFAMKCFFHEALMFFKYSAKICVIDNTNLAVLRGTGSDAVFNPEMIEFARNYGFEWLAHERNHADRKAGEERAFRTINSNFFPGREFHSIQDINTKAFDWATVRYARRPQSRTRLIPVELFEIEKPYLIRLPRYIMPPYKDHNRPMDQYGFIVFKSNYYWVPRESKRYVAFIEYSDTIKIFPKDNNNKPLVSLLYQLPEADIRNQAYKPDGVNTNPYQPNNRKKPSHEEERQIRNIGSICCDYVDFIKSAQCNIAQKPRFLRDLYRLSRNMTPSLLFATLERALKYNVSTIDGLLRISSQLMNKGLYELPETYLDDDYKQRDTYQQGRFSHEAEIQDILKENQRKEHSSGE
jgi:transposase